MSPAKIHKAIDIIQRFLVFWGWLVIHVRDYILSQGGIQGNEKHTKVIRSSGKTSIFHGIILVRIKFYDYDCRYLPSSSFGKLELSLMKNNSR
jgi:hypothetical protein